MADFEEAHKRFMETQGIVPSDEPEDGDNTVLLCCECFKDEGLRLDTSTIGLENDEACPKCNSQSGAKLTKHLVRQLCYRFFVRGTIERCKYGGYPLLQFNEHQERSQLNVSPWLSNDVKLIEDTGDIGLFYYGPRFWMFGEVEPLKSLQNASERNKIIDRILNEYPRRIITEKDHFYRVRLNPKGSHEEAQYDTAPVNCLGKNRFDTKRFPVLYGSPDLQLCLHECRVSVEDNIFVATLAPTNQLNLLDLSMVIDEDATEFESLDMAIHFLFLAGKHSYDICRGIARKAKENGFDGIIYPSYFSLVRTGAVPFETVYGLSIRRIEQLRDYAQSQSIPNVALFGRPILENKVKVTCINKVIINRVHYETSFGPAYHEAFVNEIDEKGSMEVQKRTWMYNLRKLLKKKTQ